ncbi:MAG: hypothetical protein IJU01_04565 [Lachnospiraceae bacterium]|nr:hypothetical protein [Lachnospiraceae bacterium]
MAYRKTTYKFPNAIEIDEYHDGRYGAPGMRRSARKKPTPEAMARKNQYMKTVKCRRKLRAYFRQNDYFSTLTYERQNRPADMAAAKEDLRRFIRQVRAAYMRYGCELRWIANIECGTKGAWHIHIVINRMSETDIVLARLWKKGKVVSQLLNNSGPFREGEFRRLAAYITKSPLTDNRLRESSYSCSRNLTIPEPEKKLYRRWKTWHEIKVPDGYYLDKDSFFEGINPLTGWPCRSYTLLRLRC